MATTFPLFLKQLANELECETAIELFSKLGGPEKLKMEKRNFLTIFQGARAPTIEALTHFFEVIPPQKHKNLIVAFFTSHLAGSDNSVVEYLDKYLVASAARTDSAPWDKGPVPTLDFDQLKEINSDPSILRAHNALSLYEVLPEKTLSRAVRESMEKLINVNLAQKVGGEYRCVTTCSLYPLRVGTADPATVREANKLLVTGLSNYLKYEGHEDQETGFNVQLISDENRKLVLEEAKRFRKWVFSLAAEPTEKGVIPFVWISCLRTMARKELNV